VELVHSFLAGLISKCSLSEFPDSSPLPLQIDADDFEELALKKERISIHEHLVSDSPPTITTTSSRLVLLPYNPYITGNCVSVVSSTCTVAWDRD
jgi:hypothetical protein